MAEFKDMLKYYRINAGLSQSQLAKHLGVASSTISMYEVGAREPDFEMEEKIADFFNVDLNTLRGKDTEYNNMDALPNWADQIKPVEIRTLPVLGRVACGKPIFTEEEREYVTIEDAPKNVDFILIAKGDSMINARINDGDYVFIRKQSEVNNGDIAVVIIDDEATLKRVHFDKEKQILQLLPENPAYMPLVFVGDELENVQILGKAIAVMSMIK